MLHRSNHGPAAGKDKALKVFLPLRHVAWGSSLNKAYVSSYGYGIAISQAVCIVSMDPLGVAQYVTRLGMAFNDLDALPSKCQQESGSRCRSLRAPWHLSRKQGYLALRAHISNSANAQYAVSPGAGVAPPVGGAPWATMLGPCATASDSVIRGMRQPVVRSAPETEWRVFLFEFCSRVSIRQGGLGGDDLIIARLDPATPTVYRMLGWPQSQ